MLGGGILVLERCQSADSTLLDYCVCSDINRDRGLRQRYLGNKGGKEKLGKMHARGVGVGVVSWSGCMYVCSGERRSGVECSGTSGHLRGGARMNIGLGWAGFSSSSLGFKH